MDFVPSEIRLSTEQHEVMDRLTECRGQVFLTGKAGSGKSTLLQIIRNNKDFQSIVLAPTGLQRSMSKAKPFILFQIPARG
ncbi:MAG: AAA family ATPase [Saprospiraceae bacterium]|nr:AAA family ATPase [Saprospiraceae bacterium]